MTLSTKKNILLLVISISYILVIALAGFPVLPPKPDFADYAFILAGYFGLLGGILLWWQYFLGFRGLVGRFIPDIIFLNLLHKRMGKYGYLQILLHPVLMVLGYGQALEYWLVPSFATPKDIFIRLGTLAFVILSFIWITSAIFRKRIGFRWWKRMHFLSYLVLPLVLVHSYNVGTFINTSPSLKLFWAILILSYLLVIVYRISFQFGLTRGKYRLIAKTKVTSNVFRYDFEPLSSSFVLAPEPGQFAYLQPGPMREAHPYTISHFDKINNQLSFSIKQSGPETTRLADLEIGTSVFIDGPYGEFTQGMFSSDLEPVFIAGGIGVTPFISNLGFINQGNQTHLFYGNQTVEDIAYKAEVDSNQNIKAVHILDRQEVEGYLHGFITVDLIKETLPLELSKYAFYICGPPIMMKNVSKGLLNAGVTQDQIFIEEFAI